MSRLLILFFATLATSLLSQESLTEIKRNIFQNLNSSVNQNYIRLINEGATDNEGQADFAFPNWVKFNFESKDGDSYVLDSANYHFSDDLMLFINKGKLFHLFPAEVKRIDAEGLTYVPYPSADNNQLGYYELLIDGELQLLKKYKLIKEKVMDNPLGISHSNQKYKITRKPLFYYYNSQRKRIQEVPKKKKDLIKIFTKNRSKMLSYAKGNGLNSKSESDLVLLFTHYNELNL